jgi:hypothetical protein
VAGPRAAISGLRLSDGLPALQDRLNQIRAQKGEANQASGPRAITLISAGSHREGWFAAPAQAAPSLVSTPRRLNATAAEAQ